MCELKQNLELSNSEIYHLRNKLDKITNNISKFNKGKQSLENLIKV